MLTPEQVEHLNCTIHEMDRAAVVVHLQRFKCRFPLDFTPKFYAEEPLSRLQHILFGLCLHNKRMIDDDVPAARAA